MKIHTLKIISVIFALTIFVIALVTAAPIARANNPNATLNVTANWVTTGNKTGSSDFLGTLNNKPLLFKTNKVERMRLDTLGNVGIGTNAPGSKLTVAGVIESTSGGIKFPDGSTQTTAVTGGPNGWRLGGNAGTNPATNFVGTTDAQALVLKTNNSERVRIDSSGKVGIGTTNPAYKLDIAGGETSGYPLIRLNDTDTNGHKFWLYGRANNIAGQFGLYDETVGAYRLIVGANGSVGIGVLYPGTTNARLVVKGLGTTFNTAGLVVANGADASSLIVYDDKTVEIGALDGSSTTHACYKDGYTFAGCSSAAEYVPTMDSGNGFPETADLVSIAPNNKNPYGDEHGPFVVEKSTTPCDMNLLGFIVKPESGADGVKKNDHYLPLAIYGYFPAKVTNANGNIRRGDPLTSSGKPGYAMKSTSACKIIGYALEDANADGTIQVFANSGESTTSEVAALKQENEMLKALLAQMDTRLRTLEQTSPVAQAHYSVSP